LQKGWGSLILEIWKQTRHPKLGFAPPGVR
jgi:hypothetical protein